MNNLNQGHEFNAPSKEHTLSTFPNKLRDLLDAIEFKETDTLFEARTAVVEALTRQDLDPDFLKLVWMEYSKVCEQIVDSEGKVGTHIRAQLQIAMLVHKALIFRETGNMQRYCEDLCDAEEYAFGMQLDGIYHAINAELAMLQR